MGLDNGIIIKESTGAESSVCYWRKCWNIRSNIFDIIKPTTTEEVYEFPLSLDNIVDIYYMLKNLNEDNWFENGNSIWSWQEKRKSIKQDIKELKKLIKRMKKEENLKVFFFDSY